MSTTPAGSPQLAGRHALVTGGGRGIGLAITRAFLAHGARVTMTGRDVESLRGASTHICQQQADVGHLLSFVTADVSEREAVRQAFDQARERFGPIHILVNNAGQAASAPFLKTDYEMWRRLMAVNVDGAFHCSQAALPGMVEAGWGRIVNVASIAGLIGQAYIAAYCASKHALVGLTRALAVEVAAKGITVNAVCPGYTETEMVQQSVANIVRKTGRSEEQARQELIGRNPLKRMIKPEEVANAVAWLCLPGSEAVNGQAIVISGGEV
ncbi:MAG: SDR family NAD(P)-dependent oxidoreductase [Terriglobales bacterium]